MRRWTAWCVVLALALTLAGCGGQEPPAEPPPAPTLAATPETVETAATSAPDLEDLAELARQSALDALDNLPTLPNADDLQSGLEALLDGQGSTEWNTDAYWIACLDDTACTLRISADGVALTLYRLDTDGDIQPTELTGRPLLDENGLSVVDDAGDPVLTFGWDLLAEDGDGLPRLDLDPLRGESLPAGELSFYMTTATSVGQAEALACGYLENRQTPDPATDDMTTLLAGYRGVSIVDACVLNGLDPSLQNRAVYAEYFGIKNYRGTPEQNLYLLTCMGGVIE